MNTRQFNDVMSEATSQVRFYRKRLAYLEKHPEECGDFDKEPHNNKLWLRWQIEMISGAVDSIMRQNAL